MSKSTEVGKVEEAAVVEAVPASEPATDYGAVPPWEDKGPGRVEDAGLGKKDPAVGDYPEN